MKKTRENRGSTIPGMGTVEREDSFHKRIPSKLRSMLSKFLSLDNPVDRSESRTVQSGSQSNDYFLSPQQRNRVNISPTKRNSSIQQSGLSVLQSVPSGHSSGSAVRHAKRSAHSVAPMNEPPVLSSTTNMDTVIPSINQLKHTNSNTTTISSTILHKSLSGGGGTASTITTVQHSSSSQSVVVTNPVMVSKAATTVLCCDKCDGKHETSNCPYYKKKRDDHPDAQKNKQIGGTSPLPGSVLKNAKVVRQPGDGSCLFHSMSYGMKSGATATTLRNEICRFIQSNPQLSISDTPLQDWVKWDSNGSSVSEYARTMSRGSWGGGIEMACMSQLKGCNVHVYERYGSGFKRISAFDHPVCPESKPVIRVLYGGGVHYGKNDDVHCFSC